jgi:N-acetylglucosaminyldiphosphoundecaprenol N-acetyl-beta-D-mannosaminyltransferase
MSAPRLPTMDLLGMPLARLSCDGLLDHMFGELSAGRGGWLITANLDFLRRHVHDPETRRLFQAADVVVADGMPLVWAARLQGQALPERVAGSSLLHPIAARAAAEGRSLYLLGGAPEATPAAVDVLQQAHAQLRIVGYSQPVVSDPPTPENLAVACAELDRTEPDIVLVGLGSPKQERMIEALRGRFPGVWMIGVGVSFSFLAGHVRRAPPWMRSSGLEWVHRLAQEPRRLSRRYLLEDIPFAVELFSRSLWRRMTTPGGEASSR